MWFEDNIKRERKTQSKKQLANFLTKKPELIPVLTKKKKKASECFQHVIQIRAN